MLAEKIYKDVLQMTGQHSAADVRVGLGYTAVVLENGRCGLAFTLHEKEYESCTVIAESGTLVGRTASELISWIMKDDETACAIGLATVNALVEPPYGAAELDILDQLPIGSADTVGMIGYFGPLITRMKDASRVLHIFERKPIPELGILPDTATLELLPRCHVVVISATTLLNQTIDKLLDLCTNAREIAILGPSTPFLPGVFGERGVTLLSGIQVVDRTKVLQVVSEAGGTHSFGPAIRKLSMRLAK